MRQVFAVALGTYSRPIPSPVHQLRPAQETCEQCHWPQKFVGDKFLIKTKYADDEANTLLYTVLALKVGGRSGQRAAGIHGAHLGDDGRASRYVTTDGRRQIIPKVTYRDDEGQLVDYVSEDVKVTPEDLARGETRAMDCIDCHNRPTHAFELPERAVDRAIDRGADQPRAALRQEEGGGAAAGRVPRPRRPRERRLSQCARRLLQGELSRGVSLDIAARWRPRAVALPAIYKRNVFPDMRVTWGTHPNHVGHEDFPGCFRCHDESHKAKDGRTISQDCETCHAILAQEDENPAILKQIAQADGQLGWIIGSIDPRVADSGLSYRRTNQERRGCIVTISRAKTDPRRAPARRLGAAGSPSCHRTPVAQAATAPRT